MANPAPFPTTAYDTVDWVRSTQVVSVTSAGIPSITPATLKATKSVTGTIQLTGGGPSGALGFDPSDGNHYALVSASLEMTIQAWTGTPQWMVVGILSDFSSTINYLYLEQLLTAAPPSGPLIPTQVSMVWPGGVNVPIKNAGTQQTLLTLLSEAPHYQAGILTSVTVQLTANMLFAAL